MPHPRWLALAFLLPCAIALGAELAPLPPKGKGGAWLVEASGVGTTREAAVKDALVQAVQQAVKTLVAAETIVRKEKIVKDVVHTVAAGMAEGWRILSEEEKDGAWRVRLIARVLDRKLAAGLKNARVPLRPAKVDGEGLFAAAVTEAAAEKASNAWLARTLEGYPWGTLRFDVLATKELKERRTDRTMRLQFTVRQAVDQEAYRQFAEWLDETLEHLSLQPTRGFSVSGNRQDRSAGEEYSYSMPKFPRIDRENLCHVALLTSPRSDGRKVALSGKRYLLHKSAYQAILKGCGGPLRFRIVLQDKDGKSIRSEKFHLHGGPLMSHGYGSPTFVPSISSGWYISKRDATNSGSSFYRMDLPIDEVARVAKAVVVIEGNGY